MIRILCGSGLLVFGAAACAVPASNALNSSPAVREAVVAKADSHTGLAVPVSEPLLQAAGAPVASQDDRAMEATFRAVWREPDFQRELAESYLRGSEVEPALTQREAQFRVEVLTLINEGQLDNAIARLQSLQGDNAVYDFMLGNIYFGRGQFTEAAVEYSKAVAQMSNYRRAWQNLALAQMRNSQFEAARDAFVRVLSLGGASSQTYGFLGMMHAQTGDYVAAESAFRIVMMMEPEKETWRKMLTQSLYHQGRYAECASLLGLQLAKDPDQADLWLQQADAYVRMHETKRAAENLEIVDQLGGSTYESLSLLGSIYFNDGVLDLAVDAYTRAMAKGPDKDHRSVMDVATRLAARSAYVESKQLVKGIEEAYGAKLDLSARTELRKLQTRLAVASGATDEHVALLKQIVQDNPLDGDALIQLGNHYQKTGDLETAALRFEQAARNERFSAEAKVLHGQLLVGQNRFADALPLLRQAQELKRRDDVQKLLEFAERAASRGK